MSNGAIAIASLPGLRRGRQALVVVAALGAAAWVVGLFLEPLRGWVSLLVAAVFVLTIPLGALLFVALQHVSGARWSVPVRRVAEAIGTTLPAGAAMLLTVGLGVHTLYHWTHADGTDVVLASKAWWLNLPFFLARTPVYLAIWGFFAWRLWQESVDQDRTGSVVHTQRNVRWSVLYLLTFAITFSAASFDWIMSLDPHWATTMFAVYQFSGAFVSALATLVVTVIVLRRSGPLSKIVGPGHLQDLGRLLFGFSCFWAYLWFCQLMLIWYANMPEETIWYDRQWTGGWALISGIVPALIWVIPFFALMRREAKRSERVLLHVAACILVGRLLDVGLNAFTALDLPLSVGPAEVGATLLGVSLFLLALGWRLSSAPLVPRADPYLESGKHHHIGHAM